MINLALSQKTTLTKLERRSFTRLDHALDVTFWIVSGKDNTIRSRPLSGVTCNISLSGICLETNIVQVDGFHITHDSTMVYKNKIEVEVHLSENRVVKANGEVCWYDQQKKNSRYKFGVGVVFLSIDREEKKKLENFIF